MKVWLAEILVVLAYSSRTQFPIVLGMAPSVGLMVAGDHFVGRIELHGAPAPLTDVVREKLFHGCDKAARLLLAVRSCTAKTVNRCRAFDQLCPSLQTFIGVH